MKAADFSPYRKILVADACPRQCCHCKKLAHEHEFVLVRQIMSERYREEEQLATVLSMRGMMLTVAAYLYLEWQSL